MILLPCHFSGIGVRMSEPLYDAPSLSDVLPAMLFPQNLPSILAAHVLAPLPGETILDMCAAPGNTSLIRLCFYLCLS